MLTQHGWPDSTETHFTALKSLGIPSFTSSTLHLKFAHERCLTSSEHEGTPASTKAKTFIKSVIPLNNIPTCSTMDIYRMCRTRHFRWKGQCVTEIQLLNTPQDRRPYHQAMMPLWCSLINTLCFPQKNGCVHFRDWGWGRQRYLLPRLSSDMATPTAIALDQSFNLPLISSILVDN